MAGRRPLPNSVKLIKGNPGKRPLRRDEPTANPVGLLGLIIAAGLVAGVIEGWSVHESIYFAFVSGLTIGYGDLAPKLLLARVLAIFIGICGVLVTALVAAIAVKALTAASEGGE